MCDFDEILKEIKTELSNQKDYLTEVVLNICKNSRRGGARNILTVVDQMEKLIARVEKVIHDNGNFHLNYLYVIRCMGAIETLRWTLGQNSEFIEGE